MGLLTLFWEADSRSDATLWCQVLNPGSSCSPGQGRVSMSLSKGLSFPLLRHGKLPLVPGYFQFPAPVLELSGPFSYKCRANQPSFLSATHSFPNQTVRFERADKIFSFCCPTYNRIWKVLIFIPYLSHTHVAPLFLLPQPAP